MQKHTISLSFYCFNFTQQKFQMKYLIFLFLSISFTSTQAQKEIELINSIEIIREGVALYDNENYEKAIAQFERIEKNDTNFLLARYETALSYNALENYEKCVTICQEFLANKHNVGNENESYVYNLLGSALDQLGKTEQSLAAYDMGIEKYPYYTSYYINKAVTYKTAKLYDKAVAQYYKTLQSNPYYANAHYHLGLLAYNEDHNAEALMSFALSTIISGNSNTLYYFDNFAAGNVEADPVGVKFNETENQDDFEDINLIIRNKIALNNKYKTPSSFTYPFVKQLYVLLENLEYDKNDKGYWMQNYVPYFLALKKDKQFENMVYYLVGISNAEEMQKKVKNKLPEMKAFYAWHTKKWNEMHCNTKMTVNGVEDTYKRWFHKQKAQGAGNQNSDGKNIGPWEFYGNNGKFLSFGSYTDHNERTGYWKFYNENGTPDAEYNYKDGKFHGDFKEYDQYGFLKESGTYKDRKKDGKIYSYYKDGMVKGEWIYKDGVITEASKEYYPDGTLQYEIRYNENNKIDGLVNTYFPDGTKKSEMNWKADQRHGENKYYYINKQLASKYNYKAGKYDGDFESYYITGQLKDKGTYLDGKKIGEYVSYYLNGKRKDQYTFDESGKKNGITTQFSPNGHKFVEVEFVKGIEKSLKHYDKNGNIIKETTTKKGQLEYEYPFDNGAIQSKGVLKNGEKEGEWSFYEKNGALVSKEVYTAGKLNGKDKNYYFTGDLKNTLTYVNGKAAGYYTSFYPNGTLKSEGNYLDNQLEGKWKYYYQDGSIKSINNYLNDDYDGYQEDYDLNGYLSDVYYYEKGLFIETYQFDTLENVIDTIFFNYGTADISYLTPFGESTRVGSFKNGEATGIHKYYEGKNSLRSEGKYINGQKFDEWKWYEFGQLESKVNYQNDEKDGEEIAYHPNGEVKHLFYYNNGVDTGTWKYFYDNGKLKRDYPHQNDIRHGKSHYYSPDGDLQYVKYHDNGYMLGYSYPNENGKLKEMIPFEKETGKIIAYFANGTKSAEIGILKDWHDGNCKRYYQNGQLESEAMHEKGRSHGVYKKYYADGKLKEEGNYHYSDLNGKRTLYYANGNKKQEMSYRFGLLFGPVTFYNESGKKTKILNYYQDNIINEEVF